MNKVTAPKTPVTITYTLNGNKNTSTQHVPIRTTLPDGNVLCYYKGVLTIAFRGNDEHFLSISESGLTDAEIVKAVELMLDRYREF